MELRQPQRLDARRAGAVPQHARDMQVGLHRQVRTVDHRVQEADGRRVALAVLLGHLVEADAVLLRPVEVLVGAQPRGLRRLHERLGGHRARTGVGHPQRTAHAVQRILPALVVLALLEVGQDRLRRPALAALGRPLVPVDAVAADVDHRVDRRGAPERLAAREVDTAPIGARLEARRVVPVVLRAEQRRHRGRDVDEVGGVGRTRLDEQDADLRVLAEAVGEHAAGRSGPHDDVVVRRHRARLLTAFGTDARRDSHPAHTGCQARPGYRIVPGA